MSPHARICSLLLKGVEASFEAALQEAFHAA